MIKEHTYLWIYCNLIKRYH